MGFHAAQIEAISHQFGPMLVLAGPGSGKTTVITHRVLHLIRACKVSPSCILVITFTRAAAREMEERFQTLAAKEGGRNGDGRVSFGTFHSVFFRILKLAYRYDASQIVREEQKIHFMRELIAAHQMETEDETELIMALLAEISVVKGEMLELEHYYAKSCSQEVFRGIYRGYEEKLRRAGLLDFDDMLVLCYELFSQRPDILAAWQKKYRYILIDEFQDINRLQYEIVRMLAKPEDNLFIVGDDDQSIYRFRGAKPEIMLGFEKDYPQARRVLLGVNYRSSRQIVETAGRVIANNRLRFPKEICADKGEGKPVLTRCFADPQREAERIAEEILAYQKAGYALEDMAILARTNQGLRLFVEKLMEYDILFYTKDQLPNLYEHWISKDILTYLRIAAGSRKRFDLLQIINRPKRYISRDALESEKVQWEQLKNFYQDKVWMLERIEQLEYDLQVVSKLAPAAAINYIRKAIGYDEYLREHAKARQKKPEELYETADMLQESAVAYRSWKEWEHHIKEYGEELLRQSKERREKKEGVCLSTMHSSKGLEYRVVFLPDANEGVTPHHKAILDADVEEERRLFYVAMTRAKERLHIYYVKERYHKEAEPSPFLEEYLPEDAFLG
ncbi:MAG: ATP-dependent helicase [bacterium]|nr:ATP-dependent helicase [bacterium]